MDELQQPAAIQPYNFRKAFLISLITSLCISALIAIVVFLFGNFGETESKLIFTTLTVGSFSLTGLCSSVLYDRKGYSPLAFSGIIISIIGFLITVGAIWSIIDFDDVWKWVLTFIILAVSFAHSSLLLLARSDKELVRTCRSITIVFIAIVAVMLIYLVMREYSYGIDEFFYRLLGVFAVLDVLGTIVTPILRKFYS